MTESFGAIALVMVLLGATLFLLRKRGAPVLRSSREIEVIERVALSPQHALHLVRIGDRRVLVATAPSSCQVFCRNGEPL